MLCYNVDMTISFHTRLHSETVHLPEAAAMVGKEVRIIVVEEPSSQLPRDVSALDQLAGTIDFDFEAIEELRRRSVA
jgi:hypothetical protein